MSSGHRIKTSLYVSLNSAGFGSAAFDILNGATESEYGIWNGERSSVGISVMAENVRLFDHAGDSLSQAYVTESV